MDWKDEWDCIYKEFIWKNILSHPIVSLFPTLINIYSKSDRQWAAYFKHWRELMVVTDWKGSQIERNICGLYKQTSLRM